MKIFLPFFCFLIFSSSVAQNPWLFSHEWYLHKLEINQIEYTFPTLGYISVLTFSPTSMSIVNSSNCLDTSIQGQIEYSDDFSFEILSGGAVIPASCIVYPTQMFFQQQYSIYFQNNNGSEGPFDYAITSNGLLESLLIINSSGDKAFYGNTELSSKSFSKNTFAISPNPVKDVLTFSAIDRTENSSINIYDVFGKQILNNESVKWDSNSIDVSKLDSGIYFLKVQQKDRDVVTKKFIKL